MALRGTVMSSPSLFGALRASAGEMDRRAFHRLLRSASVCAIFTVRAPFSWQILAHASTSRRTVCSSAPSVSISSDASTSVCSPRCMASSMQVIAVWSISSSVAGTTPAVRMALTVREASAREANSASAVRA